MLGFCVYYFVFFYSMTSKIQYSYRASCSTPYLKYHSPHKQKAFKLEKGTQCHLHFALKKKSVRPINLPAF